jgi:L-alanine-DL-glutamate epimerase-like enolase superfamily enzyme
MAELAVLDHDAVLAAVAPAAAIGSLADWVDLDGHLLLADEPFTGLRFEDGRVLPGEGAGLGVAPA